MDEHRVGGRALVMNPTYRGRRAGLMHWDRCVRVVRRRRRPSPDGLDRRLVTANLQRGRPDSDGVSRRERHSAADTPAVDERSVRRAEVLDRERSVGLSNHTRMAARELFVLEERCDVSPSTKDDLAVDLDPCAGGITIDHMHEGVVHRLGRRETRRFRTQRRATLRRLVSRCKRTPCWAI